MDFNDIKFIDIRILGMDKELIDCNVLTNNNIIFILSYNYNVLVKVRDYFICGILFESFVLGF